MGIEVVYLGDYVLQKPQLFENLTYQERVVNQEQLVRLEYVHHVNDLDKEEQKEVGEVGSLFETAGGGNVGDADCNHIVHAHHYQQQHAVGLKNLRVFDQKSLDVNDNDGNEHV